MTVRYAYTLSGTAAEEQTWKTEGVVELESAPLSEAVTIATRETFQKLTQGKAVFGKPGIGCSGPYTIRKLLVERMP